MKLPNDWKQELICRPEPLKLANELLRHVHTIFLWLLRVEEEEEGEDIWWLNIKVRAGCD